MNLEGICALCRYNWIEENDLTLLCSNSNCQPLECHLFCLNYLDNKNNNKDGKGKKNGMITLPEEERDWYCPACHPYGNLINLIQYFQWHLQTMKEFEMEKKQINTQEQFSQILQESNIIGMVFRLKTRYPSENIHLGRIVDRRIYNQNLEFFVQFKSSVNGRNLPYSHWINPLHHDCGVSKDIVRINIPSKDKNFSWTLATTFYLSGFEFQNINSSNTTRKNFDCIYISFDDNQIIDLQKERNSRSTSATEPILVLPYSSADEDHSVNISPVHRSMAQCESYERELVLWRYQSFRADRTLHSPIIVDELSPSWRTMTVDDMKFYLPNHPNTEEYNAWLSHKRYFSSGALLDGGSLHDMIRFLATKQFPPTKSSGSFTSTTSTTPTTTTAIVKDSLESSPSELPISTTSTTPATQITSPPLPTPPPPPTTTTTTATMKPTKTTKQTKTATTSSSSTTTTTNSNKLIIHPAVFSEITRSLMIHCHRSGSKKRKWENERNVLIQQIEDREVACADLNKVTFQNSSPMLLKMVPIGHQKEHALNESHQEYSKICCFKRNLESNDSSQVDFPMAQWKEYNGFHDLQHAYEIVTSQKTQSQPPEPAQPPPPASQPPQQQEQQRGEEGGARGGGRGRIGARGRGRVRGWGRGGRK